MLYTGFWQELGSRADTVIRRVLTELARHPNSGVPSDLEGGSITNMVGTLSLLVINAPLKLALCLHPPKLWSLKRFLRDLGITGPPGEHLPYWDQIPYTRFLFDFW